MGQAGREERPGREGRGAWRGKCGGAGLGAARTGSLYINLHNELVQFVTIYINFGMKKS